MKREALVPVRRSAADVRQSRQLVAAAVRRAIVEASNPQRGTLVADLVSTDVVLQRWAESVGSGLANTQEGEWEEGAESIWPPLDDDTATVVDQTILHAPRRYSQLVRRWYRTPLSSTVIANDMGVSRSGLYLEWNSSLWYFKAAFSATKHKTLLRLLDDQV